jgi:hypothetical protein
VKKLSLLCAASLLALGTLPVHAQTSTGTSTTSMSGRSGDGWSLLPYTRRGYVGLNLGNPDYKLRCVSGFSCDDPNLGAHIYTGGLFNDWIGAEVGYLWLGNADRGGGEVRADGLNFSLVLRAPLGQFNVFAKGGATYGRTRVNADVLSGVTRGSERDWAGSYGFGAGYDFRPNQGVVVEWARHDFKYPDGVKRSADLTSVGYVHRF